ncbi:MAG: hypothetical protein ACU833_08785 [Gammaproteobacteria bacterium]
MLLLIMTIFGSAGCAVLNLPLERDGDYPAAWPEILPLAPGCRDLDGDYAVTGTQSDGKESLRKVALAGFIRSGEIELEGAEVLSIKVENTEPGTGFRRSAAMLHIAAARFTARRRVNGRGQGGGLSVKLPCDCRDGALYCGVSQPGFNGAPLFFLATAADLYFAKGMDGSLLVKRKKIYVGLSLLAPLYWQTWNWGRFQRSGESGGFPRPDP